MHKTCLVTKFLFLLLLNLGALNVHLGFVVGCHEAEREALFKFKHSLDHPNKSLPSWEGVDCCHWKGVGCDYVTAYVNRLDLRNPYVSDGLTFRAFLEAPKLDPSLVELKHLSYLDLSYNDFQDSQIPVFIGSFKYLRYLNLSTSSFTGVVPSQLGNLSRLQNLDLSYNDYELPNDSRWLSALLSLQYLDMSGIHTIWSRNYMHALTMLPSSLGLRFEQCELGNPHFYSLFSNSTWLPRIHQLDLSRNGLEGMLPHFFTNMTSLTYLDLSDNIFNGLIPLWMRNMTKLEYLNLERNSFSGVEGEAIMGILGNLCKLKTFDISDNSIRGSIGTNHNFCNCASYSLEFLQLGSHDWDGKNMIGGALPSWLSKFENLRILDIRNNRINGRIPDLGQWKAIERIDLSSNFLQGVVSESQLANLSKLDYVDFSYNHLDWNLSSNWSPPFQLSELRMKSCKMQSSFPQWIESQTNLRFLDLSDNMITGELFQLSSSTRLLEINISHNQITGPVPYFSSSDLQAIDLSHNMLSGPLLHDGSSAKNDIVGTPICQLPNLRFIDLQTNKIVGTIPDCWGNTDSLEYINLSSNNFSGNIPMSMGLLSELQFLKLSNNSLDGSIQPTLSTKLQILDLGQNKLAGSIPNNWGHAKHSYLRMLILRGNRLVGTIPPTLCSIRTLQLIDLAHNNLTGGIPRCFGHLIAMGAPTSRGHKGDSAAMPSSLSTAEYVAWDRPPKVYVVVTAPPTYTDPQDDITTVVLKGAELQYTTTLKYVVNLDLSCNALVGSIPEDITNLSTLIALNLSHNHLTGYIPKKIGGMTSLTSVDLSSNNLSGTIPPSISALTFMSSLNLSYNNLHGQIPTGPELQVIENPSMAYIGNPGLCGDPLPNKCKTSHDQNQPTQEQQVPVKEDKWEKPLFYFVIMSGFASGFWAVVGSLLLKRRFRFALFQLVDRVTDYFYVKVMLRLNRLRH